MCLDDFRILDEVWNVANADKFENRSNEDESETTCDAAYYGNK